MPVRKPPQLTSDEPTSDRERAEEEVISRAAHRTGNKSQPVKRVKRKQLLIRLDETILDRITAVANKRGITRQGWIQYKIIEMLEQEEAQ